MKHIDKVFKDKLYNQKANVPDGMWEKIAPALEEESGRSALWFWFAGVMTLLMATMAYLLYANYSTDASSPLAMEEQTERITDIQPAQNVLASNDMDSNFEMNDVQVSTQNNMPENKEVKASLITKSPQKENTKASKISKKVIVASKKTSPKIGTASTPMAYQESTITENVKGKPANLVITRSYLSNNGSIIKKSNLSHDSVSKPTYNVFINSEGLNVGALLRIVEPLENIPLPAFNQTLKKKITL